MGENRQLEKKIRKIILRGRKKKILRALHLGRRKKFLFCVFAKNKYAKPCGASFFLSLEEEKSHLGAGGSGLCSLKTWPRVPAAPGRGHNSRRLHPARAPLGFTSARSPCKQSRGASPRPPAPASPALAPENLSWPFRESWPPPHPYSSLPPPLVFGFSCWGPAPLRPG